MAQKKKIKNIFKLQLPAKKATPAPPVGPVLSQNGLNIMDFVSKFNKATEKMEDGMIVPVEVTVFHDNSFAMDLKTPPASYLLKKAAGIMKGSGEPNKEKVGKLSRQKVEEIAKLKMKDLNTDNLDQAVKIIAGSARSMGLEIEQ